MPAIDREVMGHETAVIKRISPLHTFWFKRLNHLRLFTVTVFIADSDIFTLPAI